MHPSKLALALLAALLCALAAGQSQAQTFTTMASFNGTNGEQSLGSLTLSADGSTLYGSTSESTDGLGTVFSIPTAGNTITDLATFTNSNNASEPGGTLALVGSTLYGMTNVGGANHYGTVYSVPVTGGGPTIISSFNQTDGANPLLGGLTPSANGSTFYGVTPYGGNLSLGPNGQGGGTVFSVPVTGGTPTALFAFDGTHGLEPTGSLALSGSTLYGMTNFGGNLSLNDGRGEGAIFSEPTSGSTPTVLASFNGINGAYPEGSLTLSADGSTLYGMTTWGGAPEEGTIFSIPATGGTPTVLATFNGTNGTNPGGDLTLVGSTLYGMTKLGGAYGEGTIFSIPVTGGTITTLFSFNTTDGSQPDGDLTYYKGVLYGMTDFGGAHNDGTVFALQLVPEPSSFVLLGLGAFGLAAMALRRSLSKQPS